GPSAITSPASSMPGMSGGEPGGAGYSPRRCIMSAPLSPAARTRTSTSPAPGSGSGCSSTSTCCSRIVAASTDGRLPAARGRPGTCRRRPPPGPAIERLELLEQLAAERRQPVAASLELDDPGLAQLAEAFVEHARGHRIAALLQLAEAERAPVAQLP